MELLYDSKNKYGVATIVHRYPVFNLLIYVSPSPELPNSIMKYDYSSYGFYVTV